MGGDVLVVSQFGAGMVTLDIPPFEFTMQHG
jgi:hypothetical protein